MIDLNKTIFLVDGPTEVKSLNKKFASEFNLKGKLSLRIVGCNGKNVSPEGYANKAQGIFFMALSGPFTSIICVLDRENRNENITMFSTRVKRAIIKKISETSKYKESELDEKINISVPNRMFENWIVSDVEGLKTVNEIIKDDSKQDYYDGKAGASVLKKMMRQSYDKIRHGPKLFNATRFKISKKHSPSFKLFANLLEI